MSGAMESSGVKSTNFLFNNIEYAVIGAGFLIVVIVMILIVYCKFLTRVEIRNKVKASLDNIGKTFFFNGKIKALTMTYLKMTIDFSA